MYSYNATSKSISQCLHSAIIGTHPLQGYDGCLSFTMDAWTSPNHRAFIALCIHFQKNGVPLSIILDVVEVAQV